MITNVLARWLDIDQPGRRGLRKAVRDVVPRKIAGRECAGYKTRREALYDALRDIGREQALRWAIDVAKARGAPVPGWAGEDLAATEAASREHEADLAGLLQKIEARLERCSKMVRAPFGVRLDQSMRDAEHARRVVAFARAFADIFTAQTPISVIARAFVAARPAVLRSAGRCSRSTETAEK